jgi:hypothetical protein
VAGDEPIVIPKTPILRAALLLAALATVLMACSSNSLTETTPTDERPLATPATTTTATAPTPAKSPRGLIPRKVGEIASFTDKDTDEDVLRFAVTKITTDPKCNAPAAEYAKSEHGHLVRVDLNVETAASYRHDEHWFRPDAMQWSIQGPDGFTESNLGTFAAYSCVSELLPDTLNPSSKYVMTVVLDTKNTSGVLMFQPYTFGGEKGGWEWTF